MSTKFNKNVECDELSDRNLLHPTIIAEYITVYFLNIKILCDSMFGYLGSFGEVEGDTFGEGFGETRRGGTGGGRSW